MLIENDLLEFKSGSSINASKYLNRLRTLSFITILQNEKAKWTKYAWLNQRI